MKALILLVCLAAGSSSSAFAQFTRAVEQLSAGNVEMVERYFSTLQEKFESGKASEYELLDAYKVFYQAEDRSGPHLNNWIKAYPKSASAYLARGVYYRKLGEHRRGTDYVSKVSGESLVYMDQMFGLSKTDLETSLRLNPRFYLAALHLLNIAQYEGDEFAARKYLDLGNSLLPANFIVRARYLIHLTPRWGGSYDAMDRFINECRTQGVSNERIDLLKAIKLNDLGFVAEEKKQYIKARSAYEDALNFSISGGPRFRRDYLSYAARMCNEPGYSSKQYCQ
ncbi:MAG: DUF4034 domain-containing protein [Pseudomonadota bacterium]